MSEESWNESLYEWYVEVAKEYLESMVTKGLHIDLIDRPNRWSCSDDTHTYRYEPRGGGYSDLTSIDSWLASTGKFINYETETNLIGYVSASGFIEMCVEQLEDDYEPKVRRV